MKKINKIILALIFLIIINGVIIIKNHRKEEYVYFTYENIQGKSDKCSIGSNQIATCEVDGSLIKVSNFYVVK